MTRSSPTLESLATDLGSGRTSSRALVEACLERIADPKGEGDRTFVGVDADRARRAADAMDGLRSAGAAPSRFAGIPLSVKDLFDVAGEVTRAGSRVLADAPPAEQDATVIARMRAAGFVIIGRTNMTEFAYSGLGINPHYGTPAAPWQRSTAARVPGGSSSGAAVSIADGMAHGALGTDTGGSCRIPAAFCGITGYKPTARLVPQDGIVPLAPSLDAAGPLARSVRCCAILHGAISAATVRHPPLALNGLRLAVPQTIALDELDSEVAATFASALSRLSESGARVSDNPFTAFARVPVVNAKGGFPAMESYAWHRPYIESSRSLYDPRVVSRILRGADCMAADYRDLLAARQILVEEAESQLAPFDALVLPTVATVPPRIADLAEDAAYARANILSLRNCTLINMIDGCAISIPVHRDGEAPVGLMLACRGGDDARLFAIAEAVEAAFR